MKFISNSRIALIVSLVALAGFVLTVQPVAHVGQPAYVLAQKLGVNPIQQFMHPVYGWVVQLLAALSGAHAVYVINLFSAACMAMVLGLVFALAYRATRKYNLENSLSHPAMHQIQLFSAIVAVLYLLASVPLWLAATRAGPLPFSLLLLISAFYLVISYHEKSGPARLIVSSLLYGIAIVEFSTAILFAPVFAVLVLAQLYATGTMRTALLFQVIGAGLLGLSLYIVQAGLFMLSPLYEWREFKHFGQVLWYILLDQYIQLSRGLPRVGWLTLALVCLLPWVITYTMSFSKKLGLAPGVIFGRVALNLILLVLGLAILVNFPLAPAAITGTAIVYLTPYILIALWFGNVTAFWSVALFRPKRFERPWATRARRISGFVFASVLTVFLVVTIATGAWSRARQGNELLLQRVASAVVDASAGKSWLISSSVLDDQIALEIRKRGLPLQMLRLGLAQSAVYMKYIADKFADQPRLESLARVGVGPFIDQWIKSSPDLIDQVAILNIPEFWLAADFEAIPDRFLFTGADPEGAIPAGEVFAAAQAFWSGLGRDVLEAEVDATPAGVALGWLKVHLSKVANNLGVMLEDQDLPDEAYICYEQALQFSPDNLSALMNLHVLAQREDRQEFEEIDQRLKEKTENIMGKVQAMSLSQVYGYVRIPELFVNRGMTFAMSGKAALAVGEMKRALALREGSTQLQLALASLYFGQQQDVQGREYYQQVLEQDPVNPAALLGLMRIAARGGDVDEARRLLQVLKDAGMSAPAVKVEEAFLEVMAGASTLALRMLQEVVRDDEKNVMALSALAAIATDLKENKVAEEAIKKLQTARVFSPALQIIMAQLAMNQGDRDTARRHLGELLRRQPGNVTALEMQLRIELSEGNRDEVQGVVRRILNVDPANALANYMLGVYHYYREEFMLAESAYRASLDARKSPEALNDLAYVLYLQKRAAEAELLVRESIALNELNPAAWDTLGVILMELERLDEAGSALQQSLILRPDNAGVMLSLALLYEKQARMADAAALARQVNARQNELSPQSQRQIIAMMRRLAER